MPTLVTEQGIVHYETYGRGRPVILLHGWLGSWALWRSTIEDLRHEFRTYALDFVGFGDSVGSQSDFSLENFSLMTSEFMDRLGIPRAPLIGHSMGGSVALSVAHRCPDRIVKVVVIGSPVQGSALNALLKASGYRSFARLVWTSPPLLRLFLRVYAHFIARDGRRVGQMITSDLSRMTVDAFFQSISTLRDADLREVVSALELPILGIYGRKDVIVNPDQAALLRRCAPHSQLAIFEDSGHFPMMDEPVRFHKILRTFLNAP